MIQYVIQRAGEPVHTVPTELEQENAELRADRDYWRSAYRKLEGELTNVQARFRKGIDLLDRIVEDAKE